MRLLHSYLHCWSLQTQRLHCVYLHLALCWVLMKPNQERDRPLIVCALLCPLDCSHSLSRSPLDHKAAEVHNLWPMAEVQRPDRMSSCKKSYSADKVRPM